MALWSITENQETVGLGYFDKKDSLPGPLQNEKVGLEVSLTEMLKELSLSYPI